MESISGFTGLAVVFLVLGLLWIVLVVVALLQIARSSELSTPMKVLWVVIVFFFPIVGTLAWFVLGRRIGDPFRR
ncbi:phospholipase D-like protein [Microcella putealis]|uniref:Phospholipase D-like protein n=1 Tax=Microcella putealis TaxID=337005 RepID=A0A4V2EXG9_9MICO|nr:PLDc N-terminal domain-containing protein [Microcella putealis]RZS59450.1 phospholipase D-like protein [Microcella putealis]TQM20075.1 phospholipase D-like protein [Microcella putealis]